MTTENAIEKPANNQHLKKKENSMEQELYQPPS
jgi:hypothetical protein